MPTNRTEDSQDLRDTQPADDTDDSTPEGDEANGGDTDDSTPESDEADGGDTDAGPLERAQDALDQGRDAAHEALKDRPPDEEALGH